jgi:5-hydroxyisourate hydrolase-like protein (transthyretin family)
MDIDSATDISVTANTITSNINAQLASKGQITGTVTDSAGNPLDSIDVTAYRWDGSRWYGVRSDRTNASGNYSIRLDAGTYRVMFSHSNYVNEYYDNALDIDSATDISVTGNTTTSNINAQLASLNLKSHITGTVTDSAGNPLQSISVTAYRWDGSRWGWVRSDQTDASGNYNIGGLDAGTYRVMFSGSYYSAYATEYYDNALDIDSATDISVTDNTTTSNINAQLALKGHITGTVTDSAGNPLQSISVKAYRWNGSRWDWVRSDGTDASGNYDIGRLNAGTYRVKFSGGYYYATEYYDKALDIDSATDISVTDNVIISNINAQLALKGQITGTVTDSAGNPLEDIWVTAYRWDGSRWDSVRYDRTDASGSYDFGRLDAGTYRVKFSGGYSSAYVSEYYDNVLDIDSATDILVTVNMTMFNISAQLALKGQITGTVTDSAGNPLEDILVWAYRWDASRWRWDGVRSDQTNASGSYDIGPLDAGTYRVKFSHSNYNTEYYDNVLDIDSATDISVTDNTITSNINAQLALKGQITGTVTDSAGNPLEDILVWAYHWDGSRWDWANSDRTDASGNYDIGLDVGTYRIYFDDYSRTYSSEYYNGALNINSATDISVTANAITSNINAQLALAAHITGTVTDSAGNPLESIRVAAYRWNGSRWNRSHSERTDASGSYDIGGLDAGTYRIEFYDYSRIYSTEYYDNALDFNNATDISVTANATTSNINAQLALAGYITGTVTDSAGNPLQSISVMAYRWDGSRWDSVNSDRTDSSGSYDIRLNAGTYRIGFSDSSRTYAFEYYNGALDIDSATDIAVTTGATTSNINAQLALAGHITGTVTDSTGNPLESRSIWVIPYRWNGSRWNQIESSTQSGLLYNGSYDIGGLAVGTYRLWFRDYSGTYAAEYYDDVPDFESATDIVVSSGTTISNTDVQLDLAAHITGTVTDSAGNPLKGINVAAYRWNGNRWVWVSTDLTLEPGSYALGSLKTGTYRLRFRDASGTYRTEYYDNALDIDSATDIAVTVGTTTSNINAQLDLAGHITGMVTDSGGDSLGNIGVTAYRWNGSRWVWANRTFTNSAGYYDLGGLGSDIYHVRFRDASMTYVIEYYDDAPNISSSTEIAVTAGATTSDINAELAAFVRRRQAVSEGTPYSLWGHMNSWSSLLSAEHQVIGDIDGSGEDDVIFDFGDGLWVWMNNKEWVQLHSSSAHKLFTGDIDGTGQDDVIVDFGDAILLWMNNSEWFQLQSSSPQSMVMGDIDGNGEDDVIIDFGTGIWLWMNQSEWLQLYTTSSEGMVMGDVDGSGQDDVIFDFGTEILLFLNNSEKLELQNLSSQGMVMGDVDGSGEDDVIFDSGAGIWLFLNNSETLELHSLSSQGMVTGDIDGNGEDDVIFDFGEQDGIWLLMNNSEWLLLHILSSQHLGTGDIDGSGEDDVIVNLGENYGIWVWLNNSIWVQLHSLSSETVIDEMLSDDGDLMLLPEELLLP